MIATSKQLRPAAAGVSRDRAVLSACAHCGLDVPAGLFEPGAAHQFCCAGCRTVYGVINSCGLDAYYRLRQATESDRAPARVSGRAYAEMDDPAFARMYIRGTAGGLVETELYLEGIHCAACVWLVEKLPMLLPGVVESRLEFRRSTVRVVWDPAQARLSRIAHALDSLGYIPHPAKEVSARDARKREDRRFMIRIAIAGAAAGNVMLLAFALYAGEHRGMAPLFLHLFRWLSAGIGILSLAWPGSVFFRGAWAALRTRTAHLDLPIAMGLGAGGIWGAINTIRGTGEIYFDSLTVLVFLLLVARWIQHRQQRRAADSIELLYSLTPTSARRVDGDTIAEVPVEALHPGDLIEVRAGDSFPVDGVIDSGQTQADQSLLTGESRPVRIGPGEHAPAGAVNLSSPVRVRVQATGRDTRIGKLMRLVSECAARRAPIVQLADRLAVYFVFGVTGLAAITLAAWLFISPAAAADHAVAVLIVTCPCALSLATPLAMTIAIGRAARRGVLIKGADALEKLSRPGLLILDKTGTVTAGRMRVIRWIGDESVRPLAAALESRSTHPVARAIADGCADGVHRSVTAVQTVGGGIAGCVDGQDLALGSPAFLQSLGIGLPRWALTEGARCAAEALSPVFVASGGTVVALAAVGDPLREDARASIAALRTRGWQVRLLSGDDPRVVAAVGAQLGLPDADCRGGATPEQKLAELSQHIAHRAPGAGPVVMVGDGVNDAAALSAADVGVAVHGGAEASLAAADIYLSRPGLAPILELTGGARRTMSAIRRCTLVSLLYNSAAATLAITGLVNPIVAAVIMPLSSFTVLGMVYKNRAFSAPRGGAACP